MRSKLGWCCLATLVFASAAAADTYGDEKTDKAKTTKTAKADATKDAAVPAMSAEEQEMMAKWQAAMTPGEYHAKLEPLIGSWKVTTTSWMEPGGEPMASTGTSESRWILGNRYIEQTFHGTFMDQPFDGHGMMGYDNVQKKYIGTWIDSMSTGMWTSTGDVDASGKVFKSTGSYWCPMAGKEVTGRTTLIIKDKNTHVMDMWTPDPKTGEEFKSMEMTYVREGTAPMN